MFFSIASLLSTLLVASASPVNPFCESTPAENILVSDGNAGMMRDWAVYVGYDSSFLTVKADEEHVFKVGRIVARRDRRSYGSRIACSLITLMFPICSRVYKSATCTRVSLNVLTETEVAINVLVKQSDCSAIGFQEKRGNPHNCDLYMGQPKAWGKAPQNTLQGWTAVAIAGNCGIGPGKRCWYVLRQKDSSS